ncbi:uncharacterized protein [Macrobrachium rosenbergii]|uniref:uncharacterized protein isoform X1 n=2 Tax=Macrobrachium rosenbergii TaxID=79674 RepID=UPI0034D718B2
MNTLHKQSPKTRLTTPGSRPKEKPRRKMKGSRFDLEAYLDKLKWDRHVKAKRRMPPHCSKNKFCVYSKDPVKDDLIWRSVVKGENSAAQRRDADYASAQDLYKFCSSRPRSPYQSSNRSSSCDRRQDDACAEDAILRQQQLYAYVTDGPPVPETSARYIGWRSTIPELRLERYNTCN